jgi:hypothetical protein
MTHTSLALLSSQPISAFVGFRNAKTTIDELGEKPKRANPSIGVSIDAV